MSATRKRQRSPSPKALASGGSCWLMKSEPYKFSIDDLAAMPSSPWDGVRNYEARNNMKAMKVGDHVLFYHSVAAKETGVAGIAVVCKEAYDDFTALDKKSEYHDAKATKEKNSWQMVDVKFVDKFPRVVTLHEIKADKALASMALIQRGRLSVVPVTQKEYEHILTVAKSAVPISGSAPAPKAAKVASKK